MGRGVCRSGRIVERSCPWSGLHQTRWVKPASVVWLRLMGQSWRWGFSVVAASRLVVVSESHLQVGQFVLGSCVPGF